MARYRNKGAPFPGPKGKEIGRGDTFEADPQDWVVRMRVNKLERVDGASSAKAPKASGEEK